MNAIVASTIGLVAMTVVVKLLGFVEKQLIAYYFGAGADVDAFFVASSVTTGLFVMTRELIEPAFLPLFVGRIGPGCTTADEASAWRLFAIVAAGIAAALVPAIAVVTLFAPQVAVWLAPGFDEGARATTASLIRIGGVGALFSSLSSLTYVTLNGYRQFVAPAAGDLAMRAVGIAACIAAGVGPLGILALGLGVLGGGASRLGVHLYALRGRLEGLRCVFDAAGAAGDARRLGLLMAPLAVAVVFSQVSELADNLLSSTLDAGAVAARSYARRIADLPILLVPYAAGVVIFPALAALAGAGERRRFLELLGNTLRCVCVLVVPVSIVTYLWAPEVVRLLLERGAFDAGSRTETAGALGIYGLGLVAFSLEAIVVLAFFARRDTRTPVTVGICGVVLNVATAAVLVGPLGIAGIALALVVSKGAKTAVLGTVLIRELTTSEIQRLLAGAAQMGVVTLVAGGAAIGWQATVGLPSPDASLMRQAGFLSGGGLVALAGSLAAVSLTGRSASASMRELLGLLRRALSVERTGD